MLCLIPLLRKQHSSTVIERLASYCESMPQTALAYFYFDFNDTETKDINSLMRSLIIQLSAQCESIPQSLLELYQRRQGGTRVVGDDALTKTLRNLMSSFHHVYFILDALDESSNCGEVLQFINTVQDWKFSQLHLMVTSRQLSEIEESLADLAPDKICLQESPLNEDITIYITETFANDKIFAKWPAEIRVQIRDKLIMEEGGM